MKKIKIEFPELPEVKNRKNFVYILSSLFFILIYFSGLLSILLKDVLLHIGANKEIATISLIIFEAIITIILCIILKSDLLRDVKYFFKNFKNYLKYDLILFLMDKVALMFLGIILQIIVGETAANQAEIESLNISFPVMLIIGVITGPFIEECVYRGLLKKVFKNKYVFIIISSLLFGLAHMDISVIAQNPLQLLYILVYATSGFILAHNYEKSKNLASCIFLHSLMNFITFLLSSL